MQNDTRSCQILHTTIASHAPHDHAKFPMIPAHFLAQKRNFVYIKHILRHNLSGSEGLAHLIPTG